MRRLTVTWATAAGVAVGLFGCDIETTPTGDVGAGDDAGIRVDSEEPAVERGVHTEPHGVGASWYAYDSETHAVTPRDRMYRFEGPETTAVLRLTSYYDGKGESGHVSLKLRRRARGAWGPVESLEHLGSIKESPVCVDLETPAAVDCESAARDLVFRTDLRTVPAAGFAVQNPSIYSTAHFSDSGRTSIGRASGDSLETVPTNWRSLPDARLDPADGLLADYVDASSGGVETPVVIQATADFRLAFWRAGSESGGVALESHCLPLETSVEAQGTVDIGEPERGVVDWPDEGGALVELCADGGPRVVESYDEPLRGGWPKSDGFELVFERFDGVSAIRVAPGHLVYATGLEALAGRVGVPTEFWEQ